MVATARSKLGWVEFGVVGIFIKTLSIGSTGSSAEGIGTAIIQRLQLKMRHSRMRLGRLSVREDVLESIYHMVAVD